MHDRHFELILGGVTFNFDDIGRFGAGANALGSPTAAPTLMATVA